MGSFNMNLSLSSIHLFLLFLFICSLRVDSQPLIPDPLKDLVCALINCGQGTCKPSNATFVGFDCECNDGWKKIQIGDLTFPSCIVPNCTLDFSCGSGSPPPPPPPAPLLPPNISGTCAHTWCGDGTCESTGSGNICKCNEGSENLLDMPGFACFKQCVFGADCVGLGFGSPTTPPPPPPSPSSGSTRNGTFPAPPPSPSTFDSTKNGPSEVPNSSRTQQALTMLLLVAISLSWI